MNENDVMVGNNDPVNEEINETGQKPSKAFIGSLIGVVTTVAVGAVIGINHRRKKKRMNDMLDSEEGFEDADELDDEEDQEAEILTESEEELGDEEVENE